MTREQFLSHVRQAAKKGRAHRVTLPSLPDDVGYVGVDGDKCDALAHEINEVGGSADIVATREDAYELLRGILIQGKVESALCWKHEVLDRMNLDELLKQQRVRQLDYDSLGKLESKDRVEQMFKADIGITSVDCAVAETGSLMLGCAPTKERVASLLPPVHVAIVQEDQIVADLLDALQQLESIKGDRMPANISFVTGPSKTGDIELQLTTGVHGPGEWRVIIIRGGPVG